MHNLNGRTSATLDVFSGNVTLADPSSIPHGGSPRNVNCDFKVGSVSTRGPLTNPFVYENNDAGPSAGGDAVDVSITGNVWNSPTHVLTEGTYATSQVSPLSLTIVNVQVLLDPSGFYLAVISFGSDVPAFASGQTYTFSGLTHYTALNGLVETPGFVGTAGGLEPNQIAFRFGSAAYGPTADTGTAIVSGLTVGTDAIDVTEFAFSVPSTVTPQGFEISVLGYSAVAGSTLSVQMLKAGVPVGTPTTATLAVGTPTTVEIGGINELFGASWVYSDLNNTQFGVRLSVTGTAASPTNGIFLGYTTVTAYFVPTQENFNYVTTFEDSFGDIFTLAIDNSGQWWLEDVSNNPGVLSPLMSGAPAGSFASSFTANSRQYIVTSDLLQGSYVPQQYTGQWTDRISQVGPGQAPTFTPISSTSDEYDISTITQLAEKTQGFSYFLQSGGPGATDPGNVITFYYLDSTVAPGPDTNLVNAFNSGQPVYLYASFVGGGGGQGDVNFGPQVVQVTSVGKGQPPGQPHQYYYFTFTVTTVAYNFTDESSSENVAHYQQTLATMTTTAPVPGLIIGNKATVSGSSVSGYDQQWTISQTPNSGSFTINETVVESGVATFSYTLINGSDPTAGQLVTITGTNNANGALNLVNATIASSSGGDSGTFTVNVSLPNFASTSEEGQATTAGTVFDFDPGAALVGSDTNPIYGDATGGTLTFAGSGQYVSPGTRKGTLFFITRNGYWTAPAPPVTFDASGDTITGIQATGILIGPPNVIARAIVFTEAGANGVPGADFFTIPAPVTYVVDNVTYVSDSLFINDNTTTTATFFFTDAVLLDAEAVDINGNDLFALAELPDAAWCVNYAGRAVFGRVRNKVQNFQNLSFDGGYLANPGGNLTPSFWTVNASSVIQGSEPTLLVSPVFGNSYYLNNQSGSTQAVFGMIYQSAALDYNLVAILQNQTAYSVRVACRTPSSATGGSLVIDLTSWDSGTGFGNTFGSYTLPLSDMSSTMTTYEGTLLTTDTLNIPSDLQLRVWAQNLANEADIEIDRIEIFPTIAPTNLTGLTISYQSDYESFDQDSGGQDTSVVNAQPANGGFVMHNNLYVVKESSLCLTTASTAATTADEDNEPATWNPFEEVSNVAGASGINAFDVGEEWAIMGCQNGLFLTNGGQPTPIQLEIQDIWQAINWQYGHTLCIRNDVANRRILCAIPLPTPNAWMPDAEENANPDEPNVILMLNYKGLGTIDELMSAAPLHMTMMGNLVVQDLRRKWSLWTIPTPYMGMVKRNELLSLLMICNGIESSKIYYLGNTPTGQDDGVPFTSSYCTYGWVDTEQEKENPLFGAFNKRFVYWDMLIDGAGTCSVTFYQNTLEAPYPFEVPGGVTLSSPAANNIQGPLNELATRLYTEIVMENGWFNLSRVTLVGAADKWSAIRGF